MTIRKYKNKESAKVTKYILNKSLYNKLELNRSKKQKNTNNDINYHEDATKYIESIKKIHPENAIQCLLVKNKIRNAFLIQPVDFDKTDMNFETELKNIKKKFNLSYLEIWAGYLISSADILQQYGDENVTDPHKYLGDFLSYPCSSDYQKHITSDSGNKYVCDISVNHTANDITNQINIMINICYKENVKKMTPLFTKINRYITRLSEAVQTLDPAITLSASLTTTKKIGMGYYINFYKKNKNKKTLPRNKIHGLLNILINFGYTTLADMYCNNLLEINTELFNENMIIVLEHIYDIVYNNAPRDYYTNLKNLERFRLMYIGDISKRIYPL